MVQFRLGDLLTGKNDSFFPIFFFLLLIIITFTGLILAAIQAGSPWFSILTRTGVFKGRENHDKYPADLVG